MVGINSTSTLSGVDHSSCDYFKEKKPQQNNFTASVARLNNTSTELVRNQDSSQLHNKAELPDIAEPGYAYFQEGKGKHANTKKSESTGNIAVDEKSSLWKKQLNLGYADYQASGISDAEKNSKSGNILTNDNPFPATGRDNISFTDGLEFISVDKRKEMIKDLVKEGYSETFIKHAIGRFSLKGSDFITK